MTSTITLIKKINKTLNKKGFGLSKIDKNTVSIGIVDFDLLQDEEANFTLNCYRKEIEKRTRLTESIFY